MNIRQGVKLLLKSKEAFIIRVLQKYPYLSSDKKFLKMDFMHKMGEKLDLENPQSFNEKIQWLKLYYRNPILTAMVDKVEVKKYVGKKIGKEYIIPTLGVWDSFDEIDFGELPKQFVLKTNHDYAGVVICHDKEKFDFNLAKRKIDKHLGRNFFYVGREWAYKDVRPKVLAETYIGGLENADVKDYKFYCFDGKPMILLISSGRQKNRNEMKWNFYDIDFNLLDITKSDRLTDDDIERPDNFQSMVDLATVLSKGLPFVRADFYNIGGKIYFGELTFYPGAGYGKFEPEEWDYKLGSYLDLSKISTSRF